MGDACFGLKRLQVAAKSSHALHPFDCDDVFIPDAAVKNL